MLFPVRTSTIQTNLGNVVRIALTRGVGLNETLVSHLKSFVFSMYESKEVTLQCLEIPCVMFAPGEDESRLCGALKLHDIAVVTSPHSATVFVKAWIAAKKPLINVATVGKGSSMPLAKAGLYPVFEPSDVTAASLANELPLEFGSNVLYPILSSGALSHLIEWGALPSYRVGRSPMRNAHGSVPCE